MDGVLAIWEDVPEEESHNMGFFSSRKPEATAVNFVKRLVDAGEDISILSAVYEDDHSAIDKTDWLYAQGLGNVNKIFVPYGKDKHDYIDSRECLPVLIDDFSKNLIAWENEGFLAIKFFNGINNMPKLKVVNGTIEVKTDTWPGYSIDHRMSPDMMYTVVTSIANSLAA